jgi:EPS-associated MarR family transcriptional regulator
MTSRQSQIQEDTTFRVLRILAQEPDISQRDLADRLGLSLGGLNYCLRALIDKGFVKLENFSNSRHKFGYVYILTPAGLLEKAALTGRFLKRKMTEYEALKAEIASIRSEASQESLDVR